MRPFSQRLESLLYSFTNVRKTMRKLLLSVMLILVASATLAQAAATWEVKRKPNGGCEVVRVAANTGPGTRVAGPFKNRKRAEEELRRLRNTPKCK